MSLRAYVFLLLVTAGITGCQPGPEKPEKLIAEKKYVDLLVELQLVRSYSETGEADSLTIDSLRREIFHKYQVSGEQFRESHHYYQQFLKAQKNRVDRAIEQLRMDQVQDTTGPGPPPPPPDNR